MRRLVAAFLIALTGCASHVSFPSRDARVTARLYKPEGAGPHAAVVLLHTCGGLTQHVTYDWPNYLVELGYVVLTVDTLGSRGYAECSRMGDRYEAQARDAYGALDYLSSQPFVDARRIAAVGFSMGAITINELIAMRPPRPAGKPEFKAFASFYGRCGGMNSYLMRKSPMLQVIPEKDNFASACIERAKSIPMEAHVLPGIYHAFDQPQITFLRGDVAGNPMLYSGPATRQARALLRDFLARHL